MNIINQLLSLFYSNRKRDSRVIHVVDHNMNRLYWIYKCETLGVNIVNHYN